MGQYIDDLKKALSSLEGSVKSDLEQMRRYQDELQSLTEMLYTTVKSGYYLRDDSRVIISAPEVIIGNVDHQGMLLGSGGSSVTLRGNLVSLEGTGAPSTGGSVVTRAASIRQTAVDPGRDGLENTVCPFRSEIVNQAVSISLRSDDISGSFVEQPVSGFAGVSIHSDTDISIDAAPSNKRRKEVIDEVAKTLDKQSQGLASSAKDIRKKIDSVLDDIKALVKDQEKIVDKETHHRTDYYKAGSLRDTFSAKQAVLSVLLKDYSDAISAAADADRRSRAIKKMKEEIGQKTASFSKDPTGSNIRLRSETINVSSVDGDGNIRENKEAGFFLSAPHVTVKANDAKSALIKDSTIDINVQKFTLSTASSKYDDKRSKGDIDAVGDVTVVSKNVTVQSVDSKYEDKKITEKALSKDGRISLRAENFSVSATDTEGKSVGDISLNAKNIQVASMDVDKEKRTDKQLAAQSQMVLLSEKIFTGSLDKSNKSKLVQVVSDKVGIMADSTAEMQQGESKAVVTLEGGNMTAGGGKNEFNGDTVINGKADIKGETTAPKGTFKSLEASSQFKSPSISDGMGAPGGGTAGKPSAKMKMEEAQKKQK